MRQLQIPNLTNKDILEDIVFSEKQKVSIIINCGELVLDILKMEIDNLYLVNKIPIFPKGITIESTPLSRLIDMLDSKITDALENNNYKIDTDDIIFSPNDDVIVKGTLYSTKKYKN